MLHDVIFSIWGEQFFRTHCDAASAIIGVDATRGSCRSRQTLHRPIHERGASQLDTFDPKPDTLNAGPFAAIPTNVEGIQFSEHLPLLAEQAHHLSIIRSMVSREGNHERARYLLHTGYAPTGSVKHPTLGSIASHYLK